jgi:hypothetical protein
MIQITPQMHVLVAVEPVDLRKGIDGLAAVCWDKLQADPFSGWLFMFRSRRAKAILVLCYDGQGFWMAHTRLKQRPFSLVADGGNGGQEAGRAPGAVTAGAGQSGNRSGAGMAPSQLACLKQIFRNLYLPTCVRSRLVNSIMAAITRRSCGLSNGSDASGHAIPEWKDSYLRSRKRSDLGRSN